MDTKLVLLNRNGKCKVVSNTKDIDVDKVKYILIPLKGFETHIMLKPNNYLNFTKAHIKYTIEIVSGMYEDEYESEILENVDIDVDNVIDFYSLIHSLNRIEYSNSFISECDVCNIFEGSYLHVKNINITLYIDDKVIYHINVNSTPCVNSLIVEHYGLFDKIKPVYDTFKNKGNKYLCIKNNRWVLVDTPEKDSLVGIYLDNTESLYIIPDDVLSMLSIVSSIEYRKCIFSASSEQNNKDITKINKLIKNQTITEIDLDEFVDLKYIDLFIDSESMIEVSKSSDMFTNNIPYIQQFIEFFAYIKSTVINNTFIFEKLYGDPINDYFDMIIRVNIYITISKSRGGKFTVFVNKNTNISLEWILKRLFDVFND